MSKVILVLALFAIIGLSSAALRADALKNAWKTWKIQNKKNYTAIEDSRRFATFVENYNKVATMNSVKNSTAKFAINKFADLTSAEFKAKHARGGFAKNHNNATKSFKKNATLPDSVDWRNKGAVTAVKDQGQCGSCWAFSATGVIEGFYFLQHQQLVSFAEQQIVDCDTATNEGCNGGWPYLAIQYAAKNGLETESDYPYTARDGSCKYNASKAIKVANGYSFVTPKSTDQLKAAIVNAPVSVLVEADQSSFQFYKSGVLTTGCGAYLNHAVLAVGYQKVGVLEAFIVKNSWGHGWGSDGYIYISTIQQINNNQGVCGILAQPVIVN